ncbi:hypothetical protein [Streptomyces prasinus]|uniref:hypothetical protein n=1 Tax=Streptomyces prasinus TaxID=67345 RepID=UPI0033A80D2E
MSDNLNDKLVEELKLALRAKLTEELARIVNRYDEALAKREDGLSVYVDEDGELREGERYEEYDEARADARQSSHDDLESLLEELNAFLVT